MSVMPFLKQKCNVGRRSEVTCIFMRFKNKIASGLDAAKLFFFLFDDASSE